MTILEISQIIFNLVVSLAVIVIAAFISVIAYEIIKFVKSIKQLLNDLDKESAEIYKKIDKFLGSFLAMSFISNISKFFNKKSKKKTD